MGNNFLLNNLLTYRDRRLHGLAMLKGFAGFCVDRRGRRDHQCRPCSLALFRTARCGGRRGWPARSWARCGTIRCRAGSSGARGEAAGHRSRRTRGIALAIAALIALRLIAGRGCCRCPSTKPITGCGRKHLAASYYDHPPVIAYAIRLGTLLFGDTRLGRAHLCRCCFRPRPAGRCGAAGALLCKREAAGATASLFFNLTLMTSSRDHDGDAGRPAGVCSRAVRLGLGQARRNG